MPTLEYIRAEIEHMRRQIGRQQKEILTLQRAGIPTTSAEALLERMQAKVDGLVEERDRKKGEAKLGKTYPSGKRINGTPAQRRA
ncbi:hypothetical protein ACVW1C_002312 [Bradyrhizobium sp. USDA 4011]